MSGGGRSRLAGISRTIVSGLIGMVLLAEPVLPAAEGSGPGAPQAPLGLSLLIRLTQDGAEILGFAPTWEPPTAEEAALLPPSSSARSESLGGLSGLVATYLSAGGERLASFGIRGAPLSFHGVPDGEIERSGEFGPRRPPKDDRLLHLPLVERAAYLLIERRGDHGETVAPLSLYDLLTPPGGSPPPPPRLPETGRLTPRLPSPKAFPCGNLFDLGRILLDQRVEAFQYHGPPAGRFDLVILGDGYTQAEWYSPGGFREKAVQIATGLVGGAAGSGGIQPFQAYSNNINIHFVYTTSSQSGISNCPTGSGPKKTYYSVLNGYGGGPSGYFGTDDSKAVEDAVSLVSSPSEIEAVLIIVNCAEPSNGGGSAFPNLKTAFVPLIEATGEDPSRFVNTAAHELAHVIATIGEEYISCCVATSPSSPFLNIVTEADRSSHDVWWKSLALASELDADGWFKAQHLPGDPKDRTEPREPFLPDPKTNMLGLWWGAQFVGDPNCTASPPTGPCNDACPTTCTSAWFDTLGAGYYRGMPRCKMRLRKRDFCRVCTKLLSESLAGPLMTLSAIKAVELPAPLRLFPACQTTAPSRSGPRTTP